MASGGTSEGGQVVNSGNSEAGRRVMDKMVYQAEREAGILRKNIEEVQIKIDQYQKQVVAWNEELAAWEEMADRLRPRVTA